MCWGGCFMTKRALNLGITQYKNDEFGAIFKQTTHEDEEGGVRVSACPAVCSRTNRVSGVLTEDHRAVFRPDMCLREEIMCAKPRVCVSSRLSAAM